MMKRPKAERPQGSPPLERRSGVDRRGTNGPKLRSLLVGGRREEIRRRADRQKWTYVDRYQQSLFGVIVIILFLSVVDAILTLLLIHHGAMEINPVMAFYLGLGPYPFLFVKYALTSVGLVVLVVFRDRFIGSKWLKAEFCAVRHSGRLPGRRFMGDLPDPQGSRLTPRCSAVSRSVYRSRAVNPDRAASTSLSLPMASRKSSILWEVPAI